jgi:hypothetical protein
MRKPINDPPRFRQSPARCRWAGAVIVLALSCCAAAARAACSVQAAAAIALDTAGHALTVPVEVNGITASFILDTGAERSVVSEAAVKRLDLARDPWVGTTMGGVGGIDRRPNADPRSLTLGGVPLERRTLNRDTSLTVATLPRSRAGDLTIDGLLGRDYLSRFDLDVDPPRRRLTLYRVADCSGRFLPWTGNYAAVPVTVLTESAMVLQVLLDGTPLRALLDTGATASLLAAPGMFRMDLDARSLAGDPSDPVSGLGPRVVSMRRHTFRSLRVGAQAIDAPAIWVAPIRLTPVADMLLGEDWLSGREIWISYATKQVFVAAP